MGNLKRFNVQKAVSRQVTVVLEEADLVPSEEALARGAVANPALADFAGLSVTVKTDFPMALKMKMVAAAGIADIADPVEKLKAMQGVIELYGQILLDWNLDNGESGPLPVSVENLGNLPQTYFDAVVTAIGKALTQVALSPN